MEKPKTLGQKISVIANFVFSQFVWQCGDHLKLLMEEQAIIHIHHGV
jgi:hypothetical protein